MKQISKYGLLLSGVLTITPAYALDASSIPVLGYLLSLILPSNKPVQTNQNNPGYNQIYTNNQINNRNNIYIPPMANIGYSYPSNNNTYMYQTYMPQQNNFVPSTYQNYGQQFVGYNQQYINPPNNIVTQSTINGNVSNNQQYALNNTTDSYSIAQNQITPLSNQNSNLSTSGLSNSNNAQPMSTKFILDTNEKGQYKWPVSTNSDGTSNPVSSSFGMRDRGNFVPGCSDITTLDDPKKCGMVHHNGIDIKVDANTPLESMSTGKVVYVDKYCSNPDAANSYNKDPSKIVPAGGCTVSVLNPNGEMITYQHLSKSDVKVGDQINAGDNIGKTGNSGGSYGAHLDLSICKVSEEKVAAAQSKNQNVSRCSQIGGQLINPLDKLDENDPRYKAAKERDKIQQNHIACMKKANFNKQKEAECRKVYNNAVAKNEAKYKNSNSDSKTKNNSEPLVKGLNMGRV